MPMTSDEALRLHHRIDQAVEKIESAVVKLVEIRSACPLHTERLEAVEVSVFGNGKDGLLTRVDRIEQKARAVWMLGSGILTLTGAVIGWFAAWFGK